ncbi:hypothetical protein RS9916_36472 [Synechococcus sp. RS9916]|nr:hypothetical protein RS9916_36472 [Synechococcus sp. RS9916]
MKHAHAQGFRLISPHGAKANRGAAGGIP